MEKFKKINKSTESIYSGKYFEDVVFEIFSTFSNAEIEKEPILYTEIKNNRYIPDMLVKIDNETYITEVKYYRSKNPQMTLINNAIKYLKTYSTDKKILVIPNFITKPEKLIIEEITDNIILLDGYDLLYLSSKNPSLHEKLKSILIMDYYDENYFSENYQQTKNKLKTKHNNFIEKIKIKKTNEKLKNRNYIKNLETIKPGKKDFKKYEKLCKEIIDFLFESEIFYGKEQLRTDNKQSRYDYIARINPTTDFWKFIVNEIKSRYVIFEFKNYSKEINQEQILTTERYLLNQALRKVAIIFSRKGGNESADKFIRGALRESGKVILVLSDDDVEEMITDKEKGDAPEHVLFKKIDELFMTLSR